MKACLIAMLALFGASRMATAADFLPHDIQKLSSILMAVEQRGIAPVQASLRGGVWEVKGWSGRHGYKVRVDARTADILAERPALVNEGPAGGALPSEVVRQVELFGFRPIWRLDWDNGNWLMQANGGGSTGNLLVSPQGIILDARGN